ncbi:SRPBCC family protein [Citreimonas sp.]|uniref:SRPBCC family protein n=1 Tax=Citreimonas sp. TaxID=3036715 RepID=UPI0040592026
MTRTVSLSYEYDACPDRLWRLVTDLAMLEPLSNGLVTFRGLPEGRLTRGQCLDIAVSPFGRLPWRPYVIKVLDRDDDTRRFHTLEYGAGIDRWEHWLSVSETRSGSRLSERIEISAGAMALPVSLWAGFMYRTRHRVRRRLLGLSQSQDAT